MLIWLKCRYTCSKNEYISAVFIQINKVYLTMRLQQTDEDAFLTDRQEVTYNLTSSNQSQGHHRDSCFPRLTSTLLISPFLLFQMRPVDLSWTHHFLILTIVWMVTFPLQHVIMQIYGRHVSTQFWVTKWLRVHTQRSLVQSSVKQRSTY